MSQAFEAIIYDIQDHILTITLNRPERMNAWTAQMHEELLAALDLADADDNVRVIIFTGAGERAYCAGADLDLGQGTFNYDRKLADGGASGDIDWHAVRDSGGKLSLRLFECKKPLIAAINGAAVGVGATMTLPMDIRLASDNLKMGFVFTRRGVVPEACSSWFLPKIVGISHSMELVLTGRIFGAQEALQRGLIRSIHSVDELLPAARAIAKEIVDHAAPVSVTLARQMLWRMASADHPMRAHELDTRLMYYRGKSNDSKEGINSFLEKRKPSYPDKVSSDTPPNFPWWDEETFQ